MPTAKLRRQTKQQVFAWSVGGKSFFKVNNFAKMKLGPTVFSAQYKMEVRWLPGRGG
jgi:hypothetical protein